jgi:hypothetical protein
MLCTSASVVWSSQYAQLLLMTSTPAPIIALKMAWKLEPAANGASNTMILAPGASIRMVSMSSSTSSWLAPGLAPPLTCTAVTSLNLPAGRPSAEM